MQDSSYPVAVPDEHLATIRRWARELPSLLQLRSGLKELLETGWVADAGAAAELWLQLPGTWSLPVTERGAASAFYLWVKSLAIPEDAYYYDRYATELDLLPPPEVEESAPRKVGESTSSPVAPAPGDTAALAQEILDKYLRRPRT